MKYDRFKTSVNGQEIFMLRPKNLWMQCLMRPLKLLLLISCKGADSETVYFQVKGALDAEGRRLLNS